MRFPNANPAIIAALIGALVLISGYIWLDSPSDFTVEIYPDQGEKGISQSETVVVIPPPSTNITISTRWYKPYEHTVLLQANNVSKDIYVKFSKTQGRPTYSSIMTIFVSDNCKPGTYPIEVEAKGGDLKTRSVTYTLSVYNSTKSKEPGLIVGIPEISMSNEPGDNGSIKLIPAGSTKEGNINFIVPKKYQEAMRLDDEGVDLYRSRRYYDALKSYDNALNFYPDYTSAWYHKGITLLTLEKYNESIECFTRVNELYPLFEDAWFYKGYALFALGKYDDSLDATDIVLEKNQTYVSAWILKGEILANTDRPNEALECFFEAVSLNPTTKITAEIWADIGKVYEANRNEAKALEYYNMATEVDPYQALYWQFKGDLFSSMANYNEAINSYNEIIKIDPNNFKAWTYKGIALLHLDNYEEAIWALDEAIKINPNYSLVWGAKGNALSSLEKYEEALQAYDEATKLDPQDVIAWHNKGVTLNILGRTNEADVAFAKVKEIEYTS